MMSAAAWRGLRDEFQKALPGTVSRDWVATVLGITGRSAANLLGPMRSFGLIDEDGTPTDRAGQWCKDDLYPSVCAKILGDVYPDDLRTDFADPGEHRAAVIDWFKQNGGVGQAGASKMAATFEMVSELGSTQERKPPRPALSIMPAKAGERVSELQIPAAPKPAASAPAPAEAGRDARRQAAEGHVLHRDIHVHIAADASAEQIDQIFAAMARHLHGRP